MTLVCVCVCVPAGGTPRWSFPFRELQTQERRNEAFHLPSISPWRRSSELLRFLSVTSKILRSNVTRSQRENQEGHENPEE